MQFDVLTYFDGDSGLYLAEVPNLQGCITQGVTPDEAKKNIQEAIEGHLRVMRDLGRTIPQPREYTLSSVRVRAKEPEVRAPHD